MYQGRTLSKWIPNPSCRPSLSALPEISQKLRAVFWVAEVRLTAYVFAPTAASQSSALFLSCRFRQVCRRSCASNLCHAQTLFSRTHPSLGGRSGFLWSFVIVVVVFWLFLISGTGSGGSPMYWEGRNSLSEFINQVLPHAFGSRITQRSSNNQLSLQISEFLMDRHEPSS
jgi:hypothetical protein